ncbi:inactive dipeptidyl peptidase 10 isoform X2 [Kryptolebias marmoratus]|uniref:inactive dipeptidyl peptidase 10 isoform X2 n=1 Tax=Kryptolebias marmoratus TaxID=37003 RepID=UPI0018ACF0CA|nr:inactive dipeptidyl peptidase 10 isoform X2 [Kryptolebias marmoratus]XP_037829711.1 inactive dipeptidyl peptidase 10 isoform X2 [Kryptolebias marmoratus]
MTASKEPTKKKPKDPQQDEEFVDVSPPQRNWKGIAISLLVIVVVCSLITLSVVVLTPAELPESSKSKLTVEDLYRPEFSLHDPEARWISDSEVVYRNTDGDVIRFNFILNETEILLSNSTFVAFKVAKYSLSPDLKYALFAYDVKPVYRYSYTASYIVYNIHTREVWELNPPEVQNSVLQYAAWGQQGHQLIYIFENNIYYQSDVRSSSLRITSSGLEGVVFNGLADWLYEEEILRSHLAHWWSPDGERLAFLTINDSLVPNMVLAQFTGSTYPRGVQYPYPTAGQTNPAVKLSVVNLFGATHTLELQPPHQPRLRDFYVTMVKWISDKQLAVRWLNRSQNASVLTVCAAATGVCHQRHKEISETWLSRQGEEPLFSEDSGTFFITLPVRQGGHGDFHHITMFSQKSQSDHQDEVRYLTSGTWEVTKLLAYDENNNVVFFLSTETAAEQRHLYSVWTAGLFPRRCLTCGLKEGCTFFDVDVSPDARRAVLRCRGPGVPAVLLLDLSDVNGEGDGEAYFILENNLPLQSALDSRRMTLTDVRMITSDSFELPLKLIFPPDFSESYLYGLLLIIGSTLGGQAVTEEFSLDWDSVLAGSEQIIVARLDGRGSGFRGQRVLEQIHQRLGSVDVDDQIAALEYVLKLPFIDPTRVGVYGEGYGGYLTLMMLKAEKPIRCAAAQAPIIDWTMYASAFSERYFGSLSVEENRYQASKVLPGMRGLQGGSLFLAHGTADANVHFQHSAELIKHLIKIGANYTMQVKKMLSKRPKRAEIDLRRPHCRFLILRADLRRTGERWSVKPTLLMPAERIYQLQSIPITNRKLTNLIKIKV